MKLETERLRLVEPNIKYAKEIVGQINNLKVTRYMAAPPHPYALKDAKQFIGMCIKKAKEKPKTQYEFSIILKQEGKLIGGFGLTDIDEWHGTADLGYWLGEKYWRKGYATEAAHEVINLAFKKLKLRKLRIPAYTDNKASNGLARKLGFKLEGTLRKHLRAKSTGKIHDENIYGLFKKEWKG